MHIELEALYLKNNSFALCQVLLGTLFQQLLCTFNEEFLPLCNSAPEVLDLGGRRKFCYTSLARLSFNDMFVNTDTAMSPGLLHTIYAKAQDAIQGKDVIPGTARITINSPVDDLLSTEARSREIKFIFMEKLDA